MIRKRNRKPSDRYFIANYLGADISFRKKIIPIPMGHKVKFTLGGWDYFGYINKQMFPGYQFKNTCPYIMRYSVADFKEEGHAWVIPETAITGPNMVRWYNDEEYRNKILGTSDKG